MDFYDEIKRLCKVRGITLDELMKGIGMSGICVYAGWRQRGCLPRADNLYKMCKILEVPMEHFFGNDEGIVVSKDKIKFIKKLEYLSDADFKLLGNLSEEQMQNLINLAKSMQP